MIRPILTLLFLCGILGAQTIDSVRILPSRVTTRHLPEIVIKGRYANYGVSKVSFTLGNKSSSNPRHRISISFVYSYLANEYTVNYQMNERLWPGTHTFEVSANSNFDSSLKRFVLTDYDRFAEIKQFSIEPEPTQDRPTNSDSLLITVRGMYDHKSGFVLDSSSSRIENDTLKCRFYHRFSENQDFGDLEFINKLKTAPVRGRDKIFVSVYSFVHDSGSAENELSSAKHWGKAIDIHSIGMRVEKINLPTIKPKTGDTIAIAVSGIFSHYTMKVDSGTWAAGDSILDLNLYASFGGGFKQPFGKTFLVHGLKAGKYQGRLFTFIEGSPFDTSFFDLEVEQSKILEQFGHPQTIELAQAWPNPFNPSTTLAIYSSEASPVRITMFDLSGKVVDKKVLEGKKGWHRWEWNPGTRAGGIYFAAIRTGRNSQTLKLVYLR